MIISGIEIKDVHVSIAKVLIELIERDGIDKNNYIWQSL